MQGTKLLNTRIVFPRLSGAETRSEPNAGVRMMPVETFVGTESTSDSSGLVTLSLDIAEARVAESNELSTPLAVVLCSADARALGKALIESADVAERLSEEVRLSRAD